MNSEELLDLLANRQIVIYGSGYVAFRFFNALKQYNLDNRVQCFVVSKVNGREKHVNEIPLIEVESLDVPLNVVICIAVHQATKEEIVKILNRKSIKSYIWIFPYLLDLELGTPIILKQNIAVKKMLPCVLKDYRVAVRYAAIEQEFGINSFGNELYIKGIALHCALQTARQRLQAFQKLIADWNRNGFDDKYPISINSEYNILDGCHRFSLACFFERDNLLCNIYESKANVYELIGEQALITRRMLYKGGFNTKEIEYLDLIIEKLNKSIKR